MGKAKMWILECEECGVEFTTRQNNFNQLPRYCDDCKTNHHPCPVCGNPVGILATYCSSRCAQHDSSNERVKMGHKLQGQAILGENNPAKRLDVRQSISEGVRNSYTPRLRHIRALDLLAGGLPVGKYTDGKGNLLRSSLELEVAGHLSEHGFDYTYEKPIVIGDKVFFPDFTLTGGLLIEVIGWLLNRGDIVRNRRKIQKILEAGKALVVITYYNCTSAFLDLKRFGLLDIVSLDPVEPELATITLKDVDVIDYAHALPIHEGKCSRYHAHSSQVVSVEITGFMLPFTDMVVDFGDAKKIVKEVAAMFDHHFVIGQKYVKSNEDYSLVAFTTVDGEHELRLPSSEVCCLEGEATIEAMTKLFTETLLDKLPPHITRVVCHLTEGIGKGAIYDLERYCEGFHNLKDLDRILTCYTQVGKDQIV